MATMSIGKAWEEASAFVARESALLLPVALLFVALPALILQEMAPPELASWTLSQDRANLPAVPGSFWLAMLLAMVIIWFGSLALFALALRPGISVGEALRLSLLRLPVLLGTALLVALALVTMILVVSIAAVALSLLSKPLGQGMAGLLGVVVVGAAFFCSVRFILLNPVVIDGHAGVVASLRQAWALTRGHFWRLLAFLVVVVLLSALLAGAAQAVLGSLAGLVAGAEAARVVGGIAGAVVSTVIQVYMLAMIARLYRQAAGG